MSHQINTELWEFLTAARPTVFCLWELWIFPTLHKCELKVCWSIFSVYASRKVGGLSSQWRGIRSSQCQNSCEWHQRGSQMTCGKTALLWLSHCFPCGESSGVRLGAIPPLSVSQHYAHSWNYLDFNPAWSWPFWSATNQWDVSGITRNNTHKQGALAELEKTKNSLSQSPARPTLLKTQSSCRRRGGEVKCFVLKHWSYHDTRGEQHRK